MTSVLHKTCQSENEIKTTAYALMTYAPMAAGQGLPGKFCLFGALLARFR